MFLKKNKHICLFCIVLFIVCMINRGYTDLKKGIKTVDFTTSRLEKKNSKFISL